MESPKRNLVCLSPLTGISSILYLLRNVDGMVSTPLRKLEFFVNSTDPLDLTSMALLICFLVSRRTAVVLFSRGWHSLKKGQSLQMLRSIVAFRVPSLPADVFIGICPPAHFSIAV